MIGLGTIVNSAAVIVGGMCGLLFKKGLHKRFQDIIVKSIGLVVIFLGVSGTLCEMITVENGKLSSGGSLMMIASMVLGAITGELINLDAKTEIFAVWLRKKIKSEGDSLFIDGFISASMTICVGAMAVVGSLKDGISGDASMLYTKAILDGIIVFIFASTFGKGAIFSVIPLAALQGSITLCAKLVEPLMTAAAVSNMSLIGSILIFCVGINLFFDTKIKVANMLPALAFAVSYSFLPL